jgi:hypothetical protein
VSLGLYYIGWLGEGVGADAFGQVKAEAHEDIGLEGVGAADATESEFSSVQEGEEDVAALDGGQVWS